MDKRFIINQPTRTLTIVNASTYGPTVVVYSGSIYAGLIILSKKNRNMGNAISILALRFV